MNKHPSLEMKGSGGTVLSLKGTAPATVRPCHGHYWNLHGDTNPRLYRSNPGAERSGPSRAAGLD